MPSPLVFETPSALQYFGVLVAEDKGLAMLEAAIAVAQDEYPELDPQAVLSQIDELAERLKRRIPHDAPALQRLSLLNSYFFGDLGFAGNINNYFDPANSYIHELLQTRRGIPISLALVYVELATQVGLDAVGVSFPGHFLVKLRMPRGEVVIDPFSGQSLSRDELDHRLTPYRQQMGLLAQDEAPLALFLQAARPRDVLARFLRNLKAVHHSAQDWQRLLPVQERLVVLLPSDWAEVRDRGLILAELGAHSGAARDLSAYLRHRPKARDAEKIERRLQELMRDSGAQWY